jgi:plastocyanin
MTHHAFSDDKVDKAAPSHQHHQIEITAFEFVPKQLSVKVGDTVTWVNKDIVPHNVYNNTSKKAISPDLATGERFSYTVPAFKTPLTLDYFCNFHPSMLGKLSQ